MKNANQIFNIFAATYNALVLEVRLVSDENHRKLVSVLHSKDLLVELVHFLVAEKSTRKINDDKS